MKGSMGWEFEIMLNYGKGQGPVVEMGWALKRHRIWEKSMNLRHMASRKIVDKKWWDLLFQNHWAENHFCTLLHQLMMAWCGERKHWESFGASHISVEIKGIGCEHQLSSWRQKSLYGLIGNSPMQNVDHNIVFQQGQRVHGLRIHNVRFSQITVTNSIFANLEHFLFLL